MRPAHLRGQPLFVALPCFPAPLQLDLGNNLLSEGHGVLQVRVVGGSKTCNMHPHSITLRENLLFDNIMSPTHRYAWHANVTGLRC